jgi:hypothetical protein
MKTQRIPQYTSKDPFFVKKREERSVYPNDGRDSEVAVGIGKRGSEHY